MKQNLNRQERVGACFIEQKSVKRLGCCCSFDCFPSTVITVIFLGDFVYLNGQLQFKKPFVIGHFGYEFI